MQRRQRRRITIAVDESGRGRPDNRHNANQPFFIVGVLITDRPQYLRDIVNELCAEENFRREIHWRDFNRTSGRVYERLAARLALEREDVWEFNATRFRANYIDYRFFGSDEKGKRPVEREHAVYNYFVRVAIESALRASHIAADAEELDIVVDAKARTMQDDFLVFLRKQFIEKLPGVNVWTRELDSGLDRLLQVCDLFSGAHNTMLAQAASGRKVLSAQKIWLGRCQQYHFPLQRKYIEGQRKRPRRKPPTAPKKRYPKRGR